MTQRLSLGICLALGLLSGCGESTGGKLTRLHTEGKNIVDASGKVITLRGVNLGGWLFAETWINHIDYALHGRISVLAKAEDIETEANEVMKQIGIYEIPHGPDDVPNYYADRVCQADNEEWIRMFGDALRTKVGETKATEFLGKLQEYPSICNDSDLPLRKKLAERFGTDGRDELLDVFQGAWITEKDVEWIKEQGFNLIRIPISFRDLLAGEDQDIPSSFTWNERAFARIDALLDWCDARNIYVNVDMQEVPGYQNTYTSTSMLYTSELAQQMTVELWEHLSDRYTSRDNVAFYSIATEPYGAPDVATRDEFHDRVIKAIRAKGDNHIVILHDGFFGMDTLPVPSDKGWTDVVYATHFFEWTLKSLDEYRLVFDSFYKPKMTEAQDLQDVPYYIGSFSAVYDTDWAYDVAEYLVGWLEDRNYNWSIWTFKMFDDPVTQDLWGLRTQWGVLGRLASTYDRPDVYLDDKPTLMRKLDAFKDLAINPNDELLAIIKNFQQ